MAEADAGSRCELIVFQCKELYLYKVPPASTIGHRAELWDVDHWLQEVSMKIVTQGEACSIKLFDIESGKFFAECPVPNPDIAPLSVAVDPVVDSSRYFVLRLEDSATKRHAFMGIGFRERGQASDFNACLAEHVQYVKRAKEAKQMHEAYTARRESEEGASTASASDTELGLKPGETITLKLGNITLASREKAEESQPKLPVQPGKPPKLRPPPGAEKPAKAEEPSESKNTAAQPEASEKQDGWGDFVA